MGSPRNKSRPPPRVTKTIRIDPDLLGRITELSFKEKCSVSEIVNMVLREAYKLKS